MVKFLSTTCLFISLFFCACAATGEEKIQSTQLAFDQSTIPLRVSTHQSSLEFLFKFLVKHADEILKHNLNDESLDQERVLIFHNTQEQHIPKIISKPIDSLWNVIGVKYLQAITIDNEVRHRPNGDYPAIRVSFYDANGDFSDCNCRGQLRLDWNDRHRENLVLKNTMGMLERSILYSETHDIYFTIRTEAYIGW